jgi:hypothetical protein
MFRRETGEGGKEGYPEDSWEVRRAFAGKVIISFITVSEPKT